MRGKFRTYENRIVLELFKLIDQKTRHHVVKYHLSRSQCDYVKVVPFLCRSYIHTYICRYTYIYIRSSFFVL